MYRALRLLACPRLLVRVPSSASAPGLGGEAPLPHRLPNAARMVSAGLPYPSLLAVTFSLSARPPRRPRASGPFLAAGCALARRGSRRGSRHLQRGKGASVPGERLGRPGNWRRGSRSWLLPGRPTTGLSLGVLGCTASAELTATFPRVCRPTALGYRLQHSAGIGGECAEGGSCLACPLRA